MDSSSPSSSSSSSSELQRKTRFDFMPPSRQTFEQTFGRGTIFSTYRQDPMVEEIENYLAGEDSDLINGYLAVEDAKNPCDAAEEFYALYKEILQNCPKAPEPSLSTSTSMVPSARETLRSQFDHIYEVNRQGLEKFWAEEHGGRVGEIDQLRSAPFATSLSSPPTMQCGFPAAAVSFGRSRSVQPMLWRAIVPFESLENQYGKAFDFGEHGLDDISKRIIAFYNAAPSVYPDQSRLRFSSSSASSGRDCFPVGEGDLFTVLSRVLTELQTSTDGYGEEFETVDAAVRSRFIQIFHYAAAMGEAKGGLSLDQIAKINKLVRTSEYAGPITRISSTPQFGSRKRPSGGGGGNPLVKGALLVLALYLGYRFVAKPAYQWIRGNQTTPVGE